MTQKEAVRKAVACLRLAKSSNPNEAALAAAKAQEIIDKYNLSTSDYESRLVEQEAEPIGRHTGGEGSEEEKVDMHTKQWATRLMAIIAFSNNCVSYHRRVTAACFTLGIIGRSSDAETTKAMYAAIKEQIVGLRRACVNPYGETDQTYKIHYCIGIVDTIFRRLRVQKEQTQKQAAEEAEANGTTNALVCINRSMEKRKADVDAWVKTSTNIKEGRSQKQTLTPARAHGQRDGHKISLHNRTGIENGGSPKAIGN